MKFDNVENFIINSGKILNELYDMFRNTQTAELKKLPSSNTVLVIVDMINGFAREGALMSSRVEGLIPELVRLSEKCGKLGIAKIAFADSHTEESPEFGAYPVHCLQGTWEAEMVEELKNTGGYKLITKNSTNGFLEKEFQNWLSENANIDTFIVTGDCTDICVQQFATTLKTWFNMQNRASRIIVPVNAVETYDLGVHNGELVNLMALYNMHINGVEIVGALE
ncbi:MAG: isochorismatase [Eubacterium sp.]|jgi:nicotinamidase-related amidase|nr:isochorismatase [Eubacterium sp.]